MMMQPPVKNEELIRRIINYWADKGYVVKVWTEKVRTIEGAGMFQIVSNLRNGLPPEVAYVLPGRVFHMKADD